MELVSEIMADVMVDKGGVFSCCWSHFSPLLQLVVISLVSRNYSPPLFASPFGFNASSRQIGSGRRVNEQNKTEGACHQPLFRLYNSYSAKLTWRSGLKVS